MALQRRFWNWKDDDLTFDLARALIGIINHGLHRGFDPVLGATLTLKLAHNPTGADRVLKDLVFSNKFGIVVTKQGIIIQEEEEPEFVITATGAESRKDLIIVTHNYVDIEGGIEALYSVLEGTATDFPALPNPEKQEILGYLTLPPNTDALNAQNVLYVKAASPNFSAQPDFIRMDGGSFISPLNATGNLIINLANPINDQDAATKFYVLQAIAESVVWSSEEIRGIIELATFSEAIDGTDHQRAVTPRSLRETLLSWIATQSQANSETVDNKFLTPKTLTNRQALETRKGVAAIATEAQAKAGTDDQTIMTPYKVRVAMPLLPVVVDLGIWDIEAAATHTFAHGLGADWDKVVSMEVTVRNDAQSSIVHLTVEPNSFKIGSVNCDLEANTTGLTLADFNSTAANRGHVTFWLKKDLPPVTAYISVNAGANVTVAPKLLKWGTPVLRRVRKTNGNYPTEMGQIMTFIDLGLNTAGAVLQAQYQKADSTWVPLNNQLDIYNSSTPMNRRVSGTIIDTPTSGMYPVRVMVSIGNITMYTNTINTDMNQPASTEWTSADVSETRYFEIPLNGFVDTVGVIVDSTAWSITSSPSGSLPNITPADNLAAIFRTDLRGTYVVQLQGNGTLGETATDEMVITISPYTNTPPDINFIFQSTLQVDPNYLADYDPDFMSFWPYYKFTAGISAYDADGDILTYQLVQVDGVNPITGAIGNPISPPDIWVVFEQSSPNSSNITVRGMTNGIDGIAKDYFFKAVVNDGNGGISERGFKISIPAYDAVPEPEPEITVSLSADTNTSTRIYQGKVLAVPANKISRITAFISAPPADFGSLEATATFGSGGSSILVPVGSLTNIHTLGTVVGSTREIPCRFEITTFGTAMSATLRLIAYDLAGNEVSNWFQTVSR